MVYILLGNGFEEIEAVATMDCLRRGGVKAVFASVGGKTVDDLRRSYGMSVYLVVRGDLSVLAESNLVVRPGDILIVKSGNLAKPSA